jgi:hypothetical protein
MMMTAIMTRRIIRPFGIGILRSDVHSPEHSTASRGAEIESS